MRACQLLIVLAAALSSCAVYLKPGQAVMEPCGGGQMEPDANSGVVSVLRVEDALSSRPIWVVGEDLHFYGVLHGRQRVELRLAAGQHWLIFLSKYNPDMVEVNVTAGQHYVVKVTLMRSPTTMVARGIASQGQDAARLPDWLRGTRAVTPLRSKGQSHIAYFLDEFANAVQQARDRWQQLTASQRSRREVLPFRSP